MRAQKIFISVKIFGKKLVGLLRLENFLMEW